jgi:choline dehydrogenase
MVPVTGTWLPSLQAAGIATTNDAYSGNNLGGFFALTAMNAANWTRSYSKSAYIDILPPRSNLHIMSDATVERILFSDALSNGNLVANTVQFSTGVGTTVQNVTVNKEVLMAGGAYGSAHILQLSGVGPKDVLEAVNVTVRLELDGVGSHMTDHLVRIYISLSATPLLTISTSLLVSTGTPRSILKDQSRHPVLTSL